jgi:hypothetical protein
LVIRGLLIRLLQLLLGLWRRLFVDQGALVVCGLSKNGGKVDVVVVILGVVQVLLFEL